MGDRISFSFVNKNEESVAFFSHWDGKEMVTRVLDYVASLRKTIEEREGVKNCSRPLDRLEPRTVMVDFIKNGLKIEERNWSNYYLEKNEEDGDNSDNGHFKMDLVSGEILW